MSKEDIRWEQRFSNYVKAFTKLDQAVTKIKEDYEVDEDGNIDDDEFLDDIIKEGIIQRFEYTHELSWKVMKDFLEDVGEVKMYGSKDATKEAFAAELITDGDVWMDMIKSRNKTSHTYNEEVADEIFKNIITQYHPEFLAFKDKMEALRSGNQAELFEEE
jgi:nucleotidyltransferase substrate binding protein (TIGR01987 family)